ncbi:hypothetical protein PHLGIDRAFT_195329 [Phlebiopsis gigantea 11061_1 CR5-6]|uniref:Uncharacterized protein n=1 Tax=Phlebiopsis gigantea (strain 11061_1 CR5-6) TaxID=745531 RepID=A0A0C3S3G4_PHLG1|nr:hypothetical protein PHLGIDRAFT_195329 [Phlebiopsis gigantea 11061_1 CR5-6]
MIFVIKSSAVFVKLCRRSGSPHVPGVAQSIRLLSEVAPGVSRNVDASTDRPSGTPEVQKPQASPAVLTVAERDAALMNAWRDREGSLANAELEDGKLEEGYRRNVKANIFRLI